MNKKKKSLVNIYQWAKIYNFLLPDFKLPPKVSCVANSVWSNSGLLLLKVDKHHTIIQSSCDL